MSNNDGCRRTHDTVQDPVREKLYPRDGVIARFLKVTAQNNDSFFCRNYPLNCFEWSTAVISCKQTARFCVGNATKQNKFEIQSRSNSIQSPYQMCSRPCHSWGRLGTRWLGHAHLLVKIKMATHSLSWICGNIFIHRSSWSGLISNRREIFRRRY